MSHIIRIWLIALGIAFGTQALAAESTGKTSNEGNLDVARSAFQRGVELFHEGNFEAALAEFQKANTSAPSYRILYNIAQTYFELHDYVAALKNYKQYLANGAAEIPPVRKTQVEETIAKLQSRIAYLEISVSVDGAQVNIDDVPVGISPLPGPVPVNPGPRRVSASKAGLATASHAITLAGADHQEVDLDLRASARGGAQSSDAPALGASATATKKAGTRSRIPLITGLAVTGAAAVTTGFFGWLALRSKNTLSRDLDTYGVSPNRVSEDRSRVRNYALITDIAAGTTLVAAGVTLYMALAHGGKETSEAAQPQPRLAVTPTLNGVALFGGW
jgi:hypothetical protein